MSRLPKLFLLGVLLALASSFAAVFLIVYPPTRTQSDNFTLQKFSETPWARTLYYDPTPILAEPGNNLTGTVTIVYQSKLPSMDAPPSVFLLSASQFTASNAGSYFSDHVYRSSAENVTIRMADRSISIGFAIKNVAQKSQHFFVLSPVEPPKCDAMQCSMQVHGIIERTVADTRWNLAVPILSLLSVAAFILDRAKKMRNPPGSPGV